VIDDAADGDPAQLEAVAVLGGWGIRQPRAAHTGVWDSASVELHPIGICELAPLAVVAAGCGRAASVVVAFGLGRAAMGRTGLVLLASSGVASDDDGHGGSGARLPSHAQCSTAGTAAGQAYVSGRAPEVVA
jgi:hypothetical protein